MIDILTTPTGTALKDFISALVKGLQTNGLSMKAFETSEKKRAKFNGQKIVLQAALNDIFSITSAPYIIIETNQQIGNNIYLFESSELAPVYTNELSENDPTYIFESSELFTVDFDFKILIPVGIYTTELQRQVSAQATLYKLAGTRFIIETY